MSNFFDWFWVKNQKKLMSTSRKNKKVLISMILFNNNSNTHPKLLSKQKGLGFKQTLFLSNIHLKEYSHHSSLQALLSLYIQKNLVPR
ncbi:hypothetical protein A9C19_14185 [Bacillus weihaiensis]|uniref:Uncharacterized protein n=1 Tax=Bacillus weihaiensis TaxID=1547283 RepID=A0A1L3MTW9_9BACI|nr:hypothetical protein A9C19_14185 [Bacillus weihaiensis]